MAWLTPNIGLKLFLIFSLPNSLALCASCPPGWLKWQQSCYIRLADKMNWFQAYEACDRPGSSLVVPNSPEENLFIWKSMVKGWGGLWIGCTDAAQEGVWLCGKEPAMYTNWHKKSPKFDDSLNCARVTVFQGGVWKNDLPCSTTQERRFAACEMTAAVVPTYHAAIDLDGRISPCLLHHEIKNVTAEGVLACGWACRAEPRCRSFNLWQGREKDLCQLNDVSRRGVSTKFKREDNCFFFEL
ncbi:C-type lectin lectoxin-Lio3-like [Acanthaster planci]|uniref:C-type lectin lectoxin-Lio3-like n=1 Tax=Acanthaster planci TaxID=133434 RepID=A0A8B7XXG9_ACAPL|nr:C-type lectin lectoxin-Lio3-like [Acanthaster planci]